MRKGKRRKSKDSILKTIKINQISTLALTRWISLLAFRAERGEIPTYLRV